MSKATKKQATKTETTTDAFETLASGIIKPLTNNTLGKIADQISAFSKIYEEAMNSGYSMLDFINGLYASKTCQKDMLAYWKLADRLANPPQKQEKKHEAINRADKAENAKLTLISSLLDMGMPQEEIDRKLESL